MNDVTRGKVHFDAGGQQRYLHFSLNAFCTYQETFDADIMEAFSDLESGKTDFVLMRRLFWVALSHEGVTEVEAGEIVGHLNFVEAAELLGKAIEAAMPEAPEDEGAPEGKPQAAAKPRKPKG